MKEQVRQLFEPERDERSTKTSNTPTGESVPSADEFNIGPKFASIAFEKPVVELRPHETLTLDIVCLESITRNCCGHLANKHCRSSIGHRHPILLIEHAVFNPFILFNQWAPSQNSPQQ